MPRDAPVVGPEHGAIGRDLLLERTVPAVQVGPEDVAKLAVHLMTNTALTGATYDIDGGQQLL